MSNHPPDMRRPGPACHSGNQAKCKNTHNHDNASAIGFIVEAVGAALAWFTLEWADHSFSLAEMAGRCYVREVASHE